MYSVSFLLALALFTIEPSQSFYVRPSGPPPPYPHPPPSPPQPPPRQSGYHQPYQHGYHDQHESVRGRTRLPPNYVPRFQKYFPGPPRCVYKYPDNPLQSYNPGNYDDRQRGLSPEAGGVSPPPRPPPPPVRRPTTTKETKKHKDHKDDVPEGDMDWYSKIKGETSFLSARTP